MAQEAFHEEVTTHGAQRTSDAEKGEHVGLAPVPATTALDIDTRVALIQALIPVALDKVKEELTA